MIGIVAILALTLPLTAQEKIDLTGIQKIRQNSLSETSKVAEYALGLSDLNGPRLSNSPGLKKAMDYVKAELNKIGVTDVRYEPWGTFGRGWQLEKLYVAMTAPYYSPLIAYAKTWTPGTNGVVSGEPVFVKIDTEADFDKYRGKLSGKIILKGDERAETPHFTADAKRETEETLKEMERNPLVVSGQTPSGNFDFASWRARFALSRKINDFLKSEGVAVVIETGTKGDDGTVFVQGGGSQTIGSKDVPPTLMMATEHYNRLLRLVKNDRAPKLDIEVKTSFFDQDTLGYNLVADIPGSDKKLKDELVLLGGHLDSWHGSTGATDNAAGSAVAMEAVRILKQSGVETKRSIRLLLWSGEEQGIFGSSGYVKNNVYDVEKKAKLKDYEKISAYYNLDNGSGKIRGIYAQSNDAVVPIFEDFLKPFNDLDANTVTIRNTGSTDHVSFDRVGVPGFQFIQDELAYGSRTHHSNMDDYDHLVIADLKQAATIMAGFVYLTANRADKLPRKALVERK